jgi:hypothetical protein
MHLLFMQAEGEVVHLPTRRAEHGASFDTFAEEAHVRLFRARYFVTGNREGGQCPRQSGLAGLAIADSPGSNVREFGFGFTGPWHPGESLQDGGAG